MSDTEARVTLKFSDGTQFSMGMTDSELGAVLVALYKKHGIELRPQDEDGEDYVY